jgi:predicted protein tyrosine phosphatase
LKSFDPRHRAVLHFHDDIEFGPGLVIPQPEHMVAILDFGRSMIATLDCQRELHLLVHCHRGISRSTAATAMLLAQLNPKRNEGAVFDRLLEIRPQAWPNSRMIELADELMARGGRLKAALGRLYAHQLTARPEIARYMQENGRCRELEMARRAL